MVSRRRIHQSEGIRSNEEKSSNIFHQGKYFVHISKCSKKNWLKTSLSKSGRKIECYFQQGNSSSDIANITENWLEMKFIRVMY